MEKLKDFRVFANAKMDLDKDLRYLAPNEHREIWNSILNVTEGSGIGCLVNIKGTTNVFDLAINSDFTLPSGTFTCNGVAEDIENGALIYFLCDTSGSNHCIFRMFTSNYKLEWVLQYDLNLKENYPVSANVLDNLLYWTDGYEGEPFIDYNPPRKINLIKATAYTNTFSGSKTYYRGMVVGYSGVCYRYINSTPAAGTHITDTDYWEVASKYVYTAITDQVLDRIKYAPYFDILSSYQSDPDYSINNLRGRLFQFRYRWIYADGEKSVWSGMPVVAYPDSDELLNGNYVTEPYINNTISLVLGTGYEEVIRMEVAARDGNNGTWQQIDEIWKYDSDGVRILNDNTITTIKFRNDKGFIPLDQADTERLYDFVPQISGGQELIEKNRLLDYNYTEGFDNTELDVEITRSEALVDPNTTIWVYQAPVGGIEPNLGMDGVWIDFPVTVPDYSIVSCVIYRYTALAGGSGIPPYGTITGATPFDVQATKLPTETMADVVARLIVLINSKVASMYENLTYGITTQYMAYAVPTVPLRIFLKRTTILNYYPTTSLADRYGVVLFTGYDYPITQRYQGFKSGATHFFGIEYFDDALRSGFVNVSDDTSFTIPYLTEDHGDNTTATGGERIIHRNTLSWSINHRPPLWAKYYRWVYGACSTEMYFTTAVPANLIFDDGNQSYIEINNILVESKENNTKLALSTYTWQKGDRIRFLARELTSNAYVYIIPYADYEILGQVLVPGIDTDTGSLIYNDDDFYKKDRATSEAFVLDQNGNKVEDTGRSKLVIRKIDKSTYFISEDINDTSKILIEVYRPRNIGDVTQLTYYEDGGLIPILSPHTDERRHNRGSGVAKHDQVFAVDGTLITPATGDFTCYNTFVKPRILFGTLFPCEAMEYSDFYDSNTYSFGRPNIIFRDSERKRYPSKIIYGGKYIEGVGGRANYLATVKSSDSFVLAQKYGTITSAKEVGFTLKILQVNKPSSLYIGRAGVTQPSAESKEILSSTKDVLGTLIVPDSDYGCYHSTSVCRFERALYYYDIYSGAIVRDSGNGPEPISKYGIKDYLQGKSKDLLASGVENISVYSVYDQQTDVVFFSFIDSKTSSNSFTIGFHEPTNSWISFYSFLPDFYGASKQILTSFKDGELWLHNSGTRMNFYGVQYAQSVKVVSNKEPLKLKNFKSLTVSSNKKWDCGTVGDLSIVTNDAYPRGQQSLIKAGSFTSQEGKFHATLGRNMLTTTSVPSNDDYVNGNEMRGDAMEVTLHNTSTDEVKLFTVEVDSIYSFRG